MEAIKQYVDLADKIMWRFFKRSKPTRFVYDKPYWSHYKSSLNLSFA